MAFETWWQNNSQKLLGSVTAFFSVLGGLVASGSFALLLTPKEIAAVGVLCALVTGVAGVGTVKRGIANTSVERVALSEATTAMAQLSTAQQMAAALNTVPGEAVPVIAPPLIHPPGD